MTKDNTIRTGDDARDYANEQLIDNLLEEHDNKNQGDDKAPTDGECSTNKR